MQSSHPEHFPALSAVQAAEVQAEKTALFWYCCRFMCGEESPPDEAVENVMKGRVYFSLCGLEAATES